MRNPGEDPSRPEVLPLPTRKAAAIESEAQRLLERCKSGDRSAFESLVSGHFAVARGLAAQVLGNLDDAEDAMQEALWKTYNALDGYRPERGSFRGWFLRIVFNQARDALRRRRARRVYEQRTASSAVSAPARGLELRETLAKVRQAMADLPAKHRAALHLRVAEELSYAEIAPILGVTPGTARVYVVRARAALRERMAGELEER